MISEDDLEDADLSVFVTDAAKETAVFGQLQQLAQSVIQNEAGSSIVKVTISVAHDRAVRLVLG
jgi:hypothetical protein